MPITLPEGLPAAAILRDEGIEVRREMAPSFGRPLEVGLVNLMPGKLATETQFARLLGAAPHPVRVTLLLPDGYEPRNAPREHVAAYYRRCGQVMHRRFDALVVTGAPVETLAFEQVSYWRELVSVMDWAARAVPRTLYVCWAAQAALWHHHAVPKHCVNAKRFGVYTHRLRRRDSGLVRGFDPLFAVPVSRHTEVREDELPTGRGLAVLADSERSGLGLVEDQPLGAVYMFDHLEYDAGTLDEEYRRDRRAGLEPAAPEGYYPGDDPACPPINTWRHSAHLLVRNWLREAAEQRATASRPVAATPARRVAP